MTCVKELLQLPTDEVRACVFPLSDVEVTLVLCELGKLLQRWLYATRYKLVSSFEVFLHLFVHVADREPKRIANAFLGSCKEGQHLSLLADVCETLFSPSRISLLAEVDVELFLTFLKFLCDIPVLKDRLGNVLVKILLEFLSAAVERDGDYRQPRACASVLITLTRGSKANKDRMKVECDRLGEALEKTTDVYLRLQCVELLFRLHVHDGTVLATSSLCGLLKRGVPKLPNDEHLLTNMLALLESYDADREVPRILQFTTILVEVDSIQVCGPTKIYFSLSMLVIMMPGYTGDNITIPYEHIRSMKLTRERKLGLRLHVVPPQLSGIMSFEALKDTLTVSLTQATVDAFRASGIRDWVAARKNFAPLGSAREVRDTSTKLYALSVPETEKRGNTEGYNAGEGRAAKRDELGMPFLEIKEEGHPSGGGRGNGDMGMFHDLNEVATSKVTRMRQDCRRELQSVFHFAEEEIEKMRRTNASERDAFNTSLKEDLIMIRRVGAQVKTKTAECVESLNQELTETQALGELLRDELGKLQDSLTSALHSSEEAEVGHLIELKTLVDAEMKSIKDKLMRLVSLAGPFRTLGNHTLQREPVAGAST